MLFAQVKGLLWLSPNQTNLGFLRERHQSTLFCLRHIRRHPSQVALSLHLNLQVSKPDGVNPRKLLITKHHTDDDRYGTPIYSITENASRDFIFGMVNSLNQHFISSSKKVLIPLKIDYLFCMLFGEIVVGVVCYFILKSDDTREENFYRAFEKLTPCSDLF